MPMTPWFSPEVKPAHKGVYLTRPVGHRTSGVQRFWNGSLWSLMDEFTKPAPFLPPRQWRGFTSEQK